MQAEPRRCQHCGRVIEGLPFRCRYCGGIFCVYCHLPEEHDCPGPYRRQLLLQREEKPRGVCEYCGATGLLFRCKYCGGWFCADHHLPPSHNCPNLEQWKSKMPPGVTIRYEGLRPMVYESVDVPISSTPKAPRPAGHSTSPPTPKQSLSQGEVPVKAQAQGPRRTAQCPPVVSPKQLPLLEVAVVALVIYLFIILVLAGIGAVTGATWLVAHPLSLIIAAVATLALVAGYYSGS